MQITLTGFALIAASILLILRRPEWILYWVIFFVPFSATAVLNISSLSYGLSAATYFSLLYLGYLALNMRRNARVELSRDALLPMSALAAFAVVVLMSNSLALLWAPLSTYQITQTIFLIFGIVMAVVFAIALTNERRFYAAMKTYRWSIVFVCLWAFVQALTFYTSVQYPAIIFNNSESDAADMFAQQAGSIVRLASVSIEPSFMAFSVGNFFVFATTVAFVQPNKDKRAFTYPAILSGLVLVMATSTSGYISLAVFVALLLLQRPLLVAAMGIPLIIVGAITLAASPQLADALYMMTFGKTSTYSGQDRFQSMVIGWEMFLRSPVLGNGWGANSSYSIVTLVLANTGIIGAATFLAALLMVLIATWQKRLALNQLGPSTYSSYLLAANNTLIVAFATSIVSGFRYVTLDLWFLFGVSISLLSLASKELELRRLEASVSSSAASQLWKGRRANNVARRLAGPGS